MAIPMPTPPTTTEVTIDPKHARLQAFLAGKGIQKSDKPIKVEVSQTELTSLLRKAKEHGYEDLIKVSAKAKKVAKDAEKAAEDDEVSTNPEPREAEPSDETTAEEELEEAEEESTPRRRRRSS